MNIKYPVGIQNFEEIRKQHFQYVDKTEYVLRLANGGKYYFLSRPRRFGKSLFVSTLEFVFRGRKELFSGLFIEDKWDWNQKNPVIKISFASISHKEKGLGLAISNQLDLIAQGYAITLNQTVISAKFQELIFKLFEKEGQVIVLIDEYDKPIIDYLGTENIHLAIENRETMKNFYSILKDADPYLKMVFITGVSKFSRVSIFSDLNNLTDLTTHKYYAGCCGITENELEEYFAEELKIADKAEIKRWYNGYTWDTKTHVYNPFSLLSFFAGGYDFKNYWFESGTPTFLVRLSKEKKLYDFDNIMASLVQLSAYEIENLQVIPLMFQTGYLTFKRFDKDDDIYQLGFPNREVRLSYLQVLAESYIGNQDEFSLNLALQLRNALKVNDLEKVERVFNSLFKSIPAIHWQNENEHFYHAIIHLTFKLLGIYVESEVQTSDGRLDSFVKLPDYIYCFEFKLDGSATKALQQIKDKAYLEPYLNEGKTCIGIGINFSKKTKKVQELKWEKF